MWWGLAGADECNQGMTERCLTKIDAWNQGLGGKGVCFVIELKGD